MARQGVFSLLSFFIAFFMMFSSVTLAASGRQISVLDNVELMEVAVVTALRKAEPVRQVAGSVTVVN